MFKSLESWVKATKQYSVEGYRIEGYFCISHPSISPLNPQPITKDDARLEPPFQT